MFQSKLFTKTRKEAPKDEVSKNAQLLIRGGFIHKEVAGVYTMLPLGLNVIKKIENIIRQEMNAVNGIEMRTTVLQNKDIWEASNRWDDESVADIWFKVQLKNGGELGLSFTNEEAYANMLKQYINSYRDLPIYPYDFKNIFRNEIRSKSGIMRGREFYWKALYSFSRDEDEHNIFYEKMKTAYQNIFNAVGIGDTTYITLASGGSFSQYSHEFQSITDAGEDTIYLDESSGVAVNKEIYNDEVINQLGLDKGKLVEKRAIEVGNIFSLGTRFSEPFNLTYKDENGEEKLVIMGSYGIGLSRLMGTIVELSSDERGIIWPESVAPFKVHLLSFGKNEEARALYDSLTASGVEVLYDDREVNPGEKLADSDLIGIPYRVVVSEKSITAGGVEIKRRNSLDSDIVSIGEVLGRIK
ncbi:prolyl-tRNA synthetase [Candidatus Campbellbacteria bacterium CG22_combo_CG10-13_8_21_14_all_36_13]|uniref:Proline--tRNA ligase n=1 Tax=Candidatus Campbellbacteria bacterium CG22_combo_CG10-13_8_21_14_all_36_13 TaxID=1974529 RepID=A0A2H0DYR8_9BACT|nr:MAG: prolyl-tRNA synthetase [Candidatus Campbellbacteria bacterium CG22_combo_CG10-13_8_21_14_all_36_13]